MLNSIDNFIFSNNYLIKKESKSSVFSYICNKEMIKMGKKVMTKDEAMRYVLDHPHGSIDKLREEIGEDRVLEFEYLGYIRNGISQTDVTYQRTLSIQLDYDTFYKEPSFWSAFPSIIFGSLAKLFA